MVLSSDSITHHAVTSPVSSETSSLSSSRALPFWERNSPSARSDASNEDSLSPPYSDTLNEQLHDDYGTNDSGSSSRSNGNHRHSHSHTSHPHLADNNDLNSSTEQRRSKHCRVSLEAPRHISSPLAEPQTPGVNEVSTVTSEFLDRLPLDDFGNIDNDYSSDLSEDELLQRDTEKTEQSRTERKKKEPMRVEEVFYTYHRLDTTHDTNYHTGKGGNSTNIFLAEPSDTLMRFSSLSYLSATEVFALSWPLLREKQKMSIKPPYKALPDLPKLGNTSSSRDELELFLHKCALNMHCRHHVPTIRELRCKIARWLARKQLRMGENEGESVREGISGSGGEVLSHAQNTPQRNTLKRERTKGIAEGVTTDLSAVGLLSVSPMDVMMVMTTEQKMTPAFLANMNNFLDSTRNSREYQLLGHKSICHYLAVLIKFLKEPSSPYFIKKESTNEIGVGQTQEEFSFSPSSSTTYAAAIVIKLLFFAHDIETLVNLWGSLPNISTLFSQQYHFIDTNLYNKLLVKWVPLMKSRFPIRRFLMTSAAINTSSSTASFSLLPTTNVSASATSAAVTTTRDSDGQISFNLSHLLKKEGLKPHDVMAVSKGGLDNDYMFVFTKEGIYAAPLRNNGITQTRFSLLPNSVALEVPAISVMDYQENQTLVLQTGFSAYIVVSKITGEKRSDNAWPYELRGIASVMGSSGAFVSHVMFDNRQEQQDKEHQQNDNDEHEIEEDAQQQSSTNATSLTSSFNDGNSFQEKNVACVVPTYPTNNSRMFSLCRLRSIKGERMFVDPVTVHLTNAEITCISFDLFIDGQTFSGATSDPACATCSCGRDTQSLQILKIKAKGKNRAMLGVSASVQIGNDVNTIWPIFTLRCELGGCYCELSVEDIPDRWVHCTATAVWKGDNIAWTLAVGATVHEMRPMQAHGSLLAPGEVLFLSEGSFPGFIANVRLLQKSAAWTRHVTTGMGYDSEITSDSSDEMSVDSHEENIHQETKGSLMGEKEGNTRGIDKSLTGKGEGVKLTEKVKVSLLLEIPMLEGCGCVIKECVSRTSWMIVQNQRNPIGLPWVTTVTLPTYLMGKESGSCLIYLPESGKNCIVVGNGSELLLIHSGLATWLSAFDGGILDQQPIFMGNCKEKLFSYNTSTRSLISFCKKTGVLTMEYDNTSTSLLDDCGDIESEIPPCRNFMNDIKRISLSYYSRLVYAHMVPFWLIPSTEKITRLFCEAAEHLLAAAKPPEDHHRFEIPLMLILELLVVYLKGIRDQPIPEIKKLVDVMKKKLSGNTTVYYSHMQGVVSALLEALMRSCAPQKELWEGFIRQLEEMGAKGLEEAPPESLLFHTRQLIRLLRWMRKENPEELTNVMLPKLLRICLRNDKKSLLSNSESLLEIVCPNEKGFPSQGSSIGSKNNIFSTETSHNRLFLVLEATLWIFMVLLHTRTPERMHQVLCALLSVIQNTCLPSSFVLSEKGEGLSDVQATILRQIVYPVIHAIDSRHVNIQCVRTLKKICEALAEINTFQIASSIPGGSTSAMTGAKTQLQQQSGSAITNSSVIEFTEHRQVSCPPLHVKMSMELHAGYASNARFILTCDGPKRPTMTVSALKPDFTYDAGTPMELADGRSGVEFATGGLYTIELSPLSDEGQETDTASLYADIRISIITHENNNWLEDMCEGANELLVSCCRQVILRSSKDEAPLPISALNTVLRGGLIENGGGNDDDINYELDMLPLYIRSELCNFALGEESYLNEVWDKIVEQRAETKRIERVLRPFIAVLAWHVPPPIYSAVKNNSINVAYNSLNVNNRSALVSPMSRQQNNKDKDGHFSAYELDVIDHIWNVYIIFISEYRFRPLQALAQNQDAAQRLFDRCMFLLTRVTPYLHVEMCKAHDSCITNFFDTSPKSIFDKSVRGIGILPPYSKASFSGTLTGDRVADDIINFLFETQDHTALSVTALEAGLRSRTTRAQESLEAYTDVLDSHSEFSPEWVLLSHREAMLQEKKGGALSENGCNNYLQDLYGCGLELEDKLRTKVIEILMSEIRMVLSLPKMISQLEDLSNSNLTTLKLEATSWGDLIATGSCVKKQVLILTALLCHSWTACDLRLLNNDTLFTFIHKFLKLWDGRCGSVDAVGCGLFDLSSRCLVQENWLFSAKRATLIEGDGVTAVQVDDEDVHVYAKAPWRIRNQSDLQSVQIFYFETSFDFCIRDNFNFQIGVSESRSNREHQSSVYLASSGELTSLGSITHITQTSKVGDTLGCGIIVAQKQVFFTKNGDYFCGVSWSDVESVFPFIFIGGKQTTCRAQVNFGVTIPFKFCFTRLHPSSALEKPTMSMLQDAVIINLFYMTSMCCDRLMQSQDVTTTAQRATCISILERSAHAVKEFIDLCISTTEAPMDCSSATFYMGVSFDNAPLRQILRVADVIVECYNGPNGLSELNPVLLITNAMISLLLSYSCVFAGWAMDCLHKIHETLLPNQISRVYEEIWGKYCRPEIVFRRLLRLASMLSRLTDYKACWEGVDSDVVECRYQSSFTGVATLPLDDGPVAVGFRITRDSSGSNYANGSSLGGCYYVGLTHSRERVTYTEMLERGQNNYYVLQDADDIDQISELLLERGHIPKNSANVVFGNNDVVWVELDPSRQEITFYRNDVRIGVGFEKIDIRRPLYPFCYLYNDNSYCQLINGVVRLPAYMNSKSLLRSKAICLAQHLLSNGATDVVFNYIQQSLAKETDCDPNHTVTALAILGGERDCSYCLHPTYGKVRVNDFINPNTCRATVDGNGEIIEVDISQLQPQSYDMPLLKNDKLVGKVVEFITTHLRDNVFRSTTLSPLLKREQQQREKIEILYQKSFYNLDRELVALKNMGYSSHEASGCRLKLLPTFVQRLAEGTLHPIPYVAITRSMPSEKNAVAYSYLGTKRVFSIIFAITAIDYQPARMTMISDTTFRSTQHATSSTPGSMSSAFMCNPIALDVHKAMTCGIRVDITWNEEGLPIAFVQKEDGSFAETVISHQKFTPNDQIWFMVAIPPRTCCVLCVPQKEGFPARNVTLNNPLKTKDLIATYNTTTTCVICGQLAQMCSVTGSPIYYLCSCCFNQWYYPQYQFFNMTDITAERLVSVYSPKELRTGDIVELLSYPVIGWECSDSVNVVSDPHYCLSVRPQAYIISETLASVGIVRADFSFSSLLNSDCSSLSKFTSLALTWRGASLNSLHPESINLPEGNLTRFSVELPSSASFWFGVTVETYDKAALVYAGLTTSPVATSTSIIELEAELYAANASKWAVQGNMALVFNEQSVWTHNDNYHTTYLKYDTGTDTLYCAGDIFCLDRNPTVLTTKLPRRELLYFFFFATAPCGVTLLPGIAAKIKPAVKEAPFFALAPHTMPIEKIPYNFCLSPHRFTAKRNGWILESGIGGEIFYAHEHVTIIASHATTREEVYVNGTLTAWKEMSPELIGVPLVLVVALPSMGFSLVAETPVDGYRLHAAISRTFSTGVAAIKLPGQKEFWVRRHDTRLIVPPLSPETLTERNTPVAVMSNNGYLPKRASIISGGPKTYAIQIQNSRHKETVSAQNCFNLMEEDVDCMLRAVLPVVAVNDNVLHTFKTTSLQVDRRQFSCNGIMFNISAKGAVTIHSLRMNCGIPDKDSVLEIKVFFALGRFVDISASPSKWTEIQTECTSKGSDDLISIPFRAPLPVPGGQMCALYISTASAYGVQVWGGSRVNEEADSDDVLTIYCGYRSDSFSPFTGISENVVMFDGVIQYSPEFNCQEPYILPVGVSRSIIKNPTETRMTVCRPLKTCTAKACIFTITCTTSQLLTSLVVPIMRREGTNVIRHLPLVNVYRSTADVKPAVLARPSTEGFQSYNWDWIYSATPVVDDVDSGISLKLPDCVLSTGRNYIAIALCSPAVDLVVSTYQSYTMKDKDATVSGFAGIVELAANNDAQPLESHVFCSGMALRQSELQSYNGIMFDIMPTANIILENITCIPRMRHNEMQCVVYCQEGGMQGIETNAAEWREVSRSQVMVKENTPYIIFIDPPLALKKDTRYGIYIQTGGSSGVSYYTDRDGLSQDLYGFFDGNDILKIFTGVMSNTSKAFSGMQMDTIVGFRGEISYKSRVLPKPHITATIMQAYTISTSMRSLAQFAEANIPIPNIEALVFDVYRFSAKDSIMATLLQVEARLTLALRQTKLDSLAPVMLCESKIDIPTNRWNVVSVGDSVISKNMDIITVTKERLVDGESTMKKYLPIHRLLDTNRPLYLGGSSTGMSVNNNSFTTTYNNNYYNDCPTDNEVYDLPNIDDDWLLEYLTKFIQCVNHNLPAESVAEKLIRSEEVFDKKTHKIQHKVKAEECLVVLKGDVSLFKIPVSALLSPASETITTPLLRQQDGTLLALQLRKQHPGMNIEIDVVTDVSYCLSGPEILVEDVTLEVFHATSPEHPVVRTSVTQLVHFFTGLSEFKTTLTLSEGQCSTISDKSGYVLIQASRRLSAVSVMTHVHEMSMKCWSFSTTGLPATEMHPGDSDEFLATIHTLINKPPCEMTVESYEPDGTMGGELPGTGEATMPSLWGNKRSYGSVKPVVVFRMSIRDKTACEFSVGDGKLYLIFSITSERGVQIYRKIDGQPTLWWSTAVTSEIEYQHIKFHVIASSLAWKDILVGTFCSTYTPKDTAASIHGGLRWEKYNKNGGVTIEDDGTKAICGDKEGQWVLCTPIACKKDFTITFYRSDKLIGEYLGGGNRAGLVLCTFEEFNMSAAEADTSPYVWTIGDDPPALPEVLKNQKQHQPHQQQQLIDLVESPLEAGTNIYPFVSGTALKFSFDPAMRSLTLRRGDVNQKWICTDLPENTILRPAVRLGDCHTYAIFSRETTPHTSSITINRPLGAAADTCPRLRLLLDSISLAARGVFEELWNAQLITTVQRSQSLVTGQNMHLTKRLYSFNVLFHFLIEYGIFAHGKNVSATSVDVPFEIVRTVEDAMQPRPVLYVTIPLHRDALVPSINTNIKPKTLEYAISGADIGYSSLESLIVQVPENTLILGFTNSDSIDLIVKVFRGSDIYTGIMRCLPRRIGNLTMREHPVSLCTEHTCLMVLLQEVPVTRADYRCLVTKGTTTHRLDEFFNENLFLPSETRFSIISGMLCALEHCHLHGIPFGCIVPENIYVNLNNMEDPDLYLWHCYDRNNYLDKYCPPETLMNGTYTTASDVWSVATIALQLLTHDYVLPFNDELIAYVGGASKMEYMALLEQCSENGRLSIDKSLELWGVIPMVANERLIFANELFSMLALEPSARRTVSEVITALGKGSDAKGTTPERSFKTGTKMKKSQGSHNGIMFDVIAKRYTINITGLKFFPDVHYRSVRVTIYSIADGYTDHETDKDAWKVIFSDNIPLIPSKECAITFKEGIEIPAYRRTGIFLHTSNVGGVQFYSDVDGATAALGFPQEENSELAITTGKKCQSNNAFGSQNLSSKRYFKGEISYTVVLPNDPRRSPLHCTSFIEHVTETSSSQLPAAKGARFNMDTTNGFMMPVVSLGESLPGWDDQIYLLVQKCIKNTDFIAAENNVIASQQQQQELLLLCNPTTLLPKCFEGQPFWIPIKELKPSDDLVYGELPSIPEAIQCTFFNWFSIHSTGTNAGTSARFSVFSESLNFVFSEVHQSEGIEYLTAAITKSGVATLRLSHASYGYILSSSSGSSQEKIISSVSGVEGEWCIRFNFERGFIYDETNKKALAYNITSDDGLRIGTAEQPLTSYFTYPLNTAHVTMLSRRIILLTLPPYYAYSDLDTATPCRKRIRAFWTNEKNITLTVGTIDDDDQYVVHVQTIELTTPIRDRAGEGASVIFTSPTQSTSHLSDVNSNCGVMAFDSNLCLSMGSLYPSSDNIICKYGIPQNIIVKDSLNATATNKEKCARLIIELPDDPIEDTPVIPEVIGQSTTISELDAVTIQQTMPIEGENSLEFIPTINDNEEHYIIVHIQAPTNGVITLGLSKGKETIDLYAINHFPGLPITSRQYILHLNIDTTTRYAKVEVCDDQYDVSVEEVAIIPGCKLKVKLNMIGGLVRVESWRYYALNARHSFQTNLWEQVQDMLGKLPSPHFIRGPGHVKRHSARPPKPKLLPDDDDMHSSALESTLQCYVSVTASALMKSILPLATCAHPHTMIVIIASLQRKDQRPAIEALTKTLDTTTHLSLLSEAITILSIPEERDAHLLEASLCIIEGSAKVLSRYASYNSAFAATIYTLLFRAATVLTRTARHCAISSICALNEEATTLPPPSFFSRISRPMMLMVHSLFRRRRTESPLCHLSLRFISGIYEHFRSTGRRLTDNELPGRGSAINFPVLLFSSDIAMAMKESKPLPQAINYVGIQELTPSEQPSTEPHCKDIIFRANMTVKNGTRVAALKITSWDNISKNIGIGWNFIDETTGNEESLGLVVSATNLKSYCSVKRSTYNIENISPQQAEVTTICMRCDFSGPKLSFEVVFAPDSLVQMVFPKLPFHITIAQFTTPYFRNIPEAGNVVQILMSREELNLEENSYVVGLTDPLDEFTRAPVEHMQKPDEFDMQCEPKPLEFYQDCSKLMDILSLDQRKALKNNEQVFIPRREITALPRLECIIENGEGMSIMGSIFPSLKSSVAGTPMPEQSITRGSGRGGSINQETEVIVEIGKLRPYLLKVLSVDSLLLELWPLVDLKSDPPPPSQGVWCVLKSVASHTTRQKVTNEALSQIMDKKVFNEPPENVNVDLMRAQPSLRKGAEVTLSASIFYQLYTQLNNIPNHAYRKAPLFKVALIGLGAVDAGGPYRDVLSKLSEEIMKVHPSKQFLMNPLFVSCGEEGSYVMPAPMQGNIEQHASMLIFFGKLLAFFLLTENILSLDFPKLFWYMLLGEALSANLLVQLDPGNRHYLPGELKNLYLADVLDFTIPGAEDTYKSLEAAHPQLKDDELFSKLSNVLVQDIFHVYEQPMAHIKSGMQEIIPRPILQTLYVSDVELSICGKPEVTLQDFKSFCDEPNLDHNVSKMFWTVVKNFSNSERSQLMQFITGQRRPPLRQRIKINMTRTRTTGYPSSSTCFSQLTLPVYNNVETMRDRLLYAINNAIMIDTDTNAPPTILATPDTF